MSELLKKFRALESQKVIIPEVIQDEKKIIENEILEKYLPEIEKTKVKIDFLEIKLTQDDTWFIYKYLTHKGTRKPKRELIPKFIELFKKNL